MEYNSPIPIKDSLSLMSYSDLKKMAVSHGIKGNMKAKYLIAKLLSVSSEDMNSFSSPLLKEVNSSQKSEKLDVAVTENAALDESNVTMCRGSERKLRPRKVNFMSPIKVTPRTPRYMSLKDRPKTPVASLSVSRCGTIATAVGENISQKSTQNSNSKNSKPIEILGYVMKSASKENVSKIIQTPIPGNAMKSASKENLSMKLKRTATPNFQRIHQKAFDKMESINDYQLRRLKNSKKIACKAHPQAKSKIPVAFSGIPFIPSVTSCSSLKFNFSSGVPKSFTGIKQTRQRSNLTSKVSVKPKASAPGAKDKIKFDLQASLSKKLGYIPYKGVLKPLSESNCMNTPIPFCHHTVKEPLNKFVHANRLKSRTMLKGVRTNKRFDLQMKNRKIE